MAFPNLTTAQKKERLTHYHHGVNSKGSPSRRLRNAIRCTEFINKKVMNNIDMYMELKYEYGIEDISITQDLTELYEKYTSELVPISVAFKAQSLVCDQVPTSMDTETTFSPILHSVSIVSDLLNGTIGSTSHDNDEEDHPLMFIQYPPCVNNRCEECGFEIVLCKCMNIVTIESLFKERENVLAKKVKDLSVTTSDYKVVKISVYSPNNKMFANYSDWPVKLYIHRLKIIYEIYWNNNNYPDMTDFHYSILFGDSVPDKIKEYLLVMSFLPCDTIFSICSEIPIFALLYNKQFGFKKCVNNCSNIKCSKYKLCYSKLIQNLASVTVLDFVYISAAQTRTNWRHRKEWKKRIKV